MISEYLKTVKEYNKVIKRTVSEEEMSKISIQKRLVFYNFLFSVFFIFCAFYNLKSLEAGLEYKIYSTLVILIGPASLVNLFLNIHRLYVLKKHRFISIEIGEFGNSILEQEAYNIFYHVEHNVHKVNENVKIRSFGIKDVNPK